MGFKRFDMSEENDNEPASEIEIPAVFVYYPNDRRKVVRTYFTEGLLKSLGKDDTSFDLLFNPKTKEIMFEFHNKGKFKLKGKRNNISNITEFVGVRPGFKPLVQADKECWPFKLEKTLAANGRIRWLMKLEFVPNWY